MSHSFRHGRLGRLLSRLSLFAILALAGVALSCRTAAPPRSSDDASSPIAISREHAPLISTHDIPHDFVLHQKLQFQRGERKGKLETVLQKRCATLTLIGLTPMRTRAFALQQEGTEVRIVTPPPVPLPFAPEDVLGDIHDALFIEIVASPPAEDGWVSGRHGTRFIEERWQAGRLQERHIRGADQREELSITYVDGMGWDVPASTIHLEHLQYGYRIELTTLDYRPLSCTDAGLDPGAAR